ncbi:MAG: hypothetical protein M1434_08270 [Chloroflexi bacterium]|nr:hypothetical protein [Chloroflexota bacterium]MCL5274726.1 hypothetical protein [Chloroflexota bacterium]
MSIEQWHEETDEPASPQINTPRSGSRLLIERIAIGIVAALSLLIPLVFGLLFYLAVSDGIVVNADDPMHMVRLWMVMENPGATGLGLTVAAPAQSDNGAPCAYTSVTFLKWDKRLRLETNASYCTCYERKNNQLVENESGACR